MNIFEQICLRPPSPVIEMASTVFLGTLWATVAITVASAGYTACAPGRFGLRCEGLCSCRPFEDCDEGLKGDGTCTCALGFEDRCDDSSPTSGPGQWLLDAIPVSRGLGPLSGLVLLNRTIRALRVDEDTWRRTRQVRNASVSRILPERWRTTSPRLALFNPAIAERIGLDSGAALSELAGVALAFSGQQPLPGSQPFAHAYGGHQFGSWAGQLGDGRAISLGEALGFAPDVSHEARRSGLRDFPWEVAVKGAGRTAYSRNSDGRAALANAAREFFAPIFLEAVGVPTTATLAVVASDAEEDRIERDEWYSGHADPKKPGIVTRVSPAFLRFGTMQLAAKRLGADGLVEVARFALEAIARLEAHDDAATSYLGRLPFSLQPSQPIREQCFFGRRVEPSCAASHATLNHADVLRCLLERTTKRTAALLAGWLAIGFAHGVMNTDNLNLLGITIDLNVYGFLSGYDPSYAPNHIDDESRYAFGAQPTIAWWNLRRLADALSGQVYEADREKDANSWAAVGAGENGWLSPEVADDILSAFDERFEECWAARSLVRFGLRLSMPKHDDGSGQAANRQQLFELKDAWHRWLKSSGADYPRASRGLAEVGDGSFEVEAARLADHARAKRTKGSDRELASFLQQLQKTAVIQHSGIDGSWPSSWRDAVRAAVPSATPRSHVLREAAKFVELAETLDSDAMPRQFLDALQHVLRNPFDEKAHDLDRSEDDPRSAWRGMKVKPTTSASPSTGGSACSSHGFTCDTEARPSALIAKVAERLYLLPPPELSRLTTSCGAQ